MSIHKQRPIIKLKIILLIIIIYNIWVQTPARLCEKDVSSFASPHYRKSAICLHTQI